MDKIEILKCVVGITKGGTPYHYFRKVKDLKPRGLFEVWSEDEVIYFWNKKKIETYDEILIAIYHLQREMKRDWKIKKLLQ